MLDRILKHVFQGAATALLLATAGCGTAPPAATAPAADSTATPGILTGIVELPSSAEPGLATNDPAAQSLCVADETSAAQGEGRILRQAPQVLPIQTTEPATADAGVMPAGLTPALDPFPLPKTSVDRHTASAPRPQWSTPKPLHRSPQMVAVIQQVELHNQQGFALASRGACFSARAEFVQALRTISAGLDAETRSSDFGRALTAGLRALEEAEDFMRRGPRFDGEIEVAMLSRGHRTPVLRGTDARDLAPAAAAQQYHKYAADQLAAAVAGEVSGSLALHSLGKLYWLFVHDSATSVIDPQGKATTFQRAALLVDPNNYLAANELAVMLAQQGSYIEARDLLLRAIACSPRPAMWHNLAVIHARLGERELAELAHRTALAASGGANPGDVPSMAALQSVRWVDPTTFTQLSPPPSDMNSAQAGATASQTSSPRGAPATKKSGMARFAPWGTRQQ